MYSEKKMTLLTAIIPMTTAMSIIKALHEMGIYTANKSAARGSSNRGVRHDIEMESLTVLIERERAEEIFDFIYEKAAIYKPNHGIIFESFVSKSTIYALPQ